MTFYGDLADINLGDVFQNINGNRLTGTLIVRAAAGKRYIYWSDGLVAGYSLGVNRGLPLAEHLLQRQYVTQPDLARAMKRKARSKCTLREALAALKLVEEDQFVFAAAELVQESLYDLLSVKEATFEFQDGKPTPRVFDAEQRAARIAVDPGAILMEGARREDEISRIHQVVTTDHDIFVMAEGFQDYELSPLQLEVAELLDGQTQVRTVLETVPHARFDILKAINDLVRFDLARPLAGRELETMARQAMADGDDDEAVALLNRALVTERSNVELRSCLADLLERMGCTEEAATELATLGYQAVHDGQVEQALDYYEQAVQLRPEDIGIQEKRLELMKSCDHADHVAALVDFVGQLVAAGLAQKARGLLIAARKKAKVEDAVQLDLSLADVAASLGHYDVAAKIYVGLARRCPAGDDEGRLEFLRNARELTPEDENLQREIADLESGRARRRRKRVRFVATAAAVLALLVGTGTMGVVEWIALNKILNTLQGRMDAIVDGRPEVVLDALHEVGQAYSWTAAGRRAARLEQRCFDLQVQKYEEFMARGETPAALFGLEALHEQVHHADRRKQLAALIHRARLEIRAEELFARVNASPPDESACTEFAALTAPTYLDFHLDRLQRQDGVRPRARQLLLEVLEKIDSPRAIPVVARLYLVTEDPVVVRLAEKILDEGPRHRKAGRASTWAKIYPVLDRAAKDPATAQRARRLLAWLRGDD